MVNNQDHTDMVECRWCGTVGSRKLMDDHEPVCDENPGCTVCGVKTGLQEHHTSYYPERTTFVCNSCHGKIHNSAGELQYLEPDQGRPDNYGHGDHHERTAEPICDIKDCDSVAIGKDWIGGYIAQNSDGEYVFDKTWRCEQHYTGRTQADVIDEITD